MADLKQSNVGKPSLSSVQGEGMMETVNHVLVDNYGFQKYPENNVDQIGNTPANDPLMVDKPTAARAEARRQYKDGGASHA